MGHCLTGSALGEQIDQIDKCGVSMNSGVQDAQVQSDDVGEFASYQRADVFI